MRRERLVPTLAMSMRTERRALRYTVVLSDVHLCQTLAPSADDPLWMRYRQSEFQADKDYAALVDHLLGAHGDHEIELVWNGDVFDFDAPLFEAGALSEREISRDEAGCAEHVQRILDDHPLWIQATARLLLAGHRLLVLSGNHDLELAWPKVRASLLRAISRAAQEQSSEGANEIAQRIRFRTWFHVTEDGIYLEHGSQYDAFSNVRFPMLPFTRNRAEIHPQMSKLAFTRTGARLGYLNPYNEESYYLGILGSLALWWRFYAFRRRRLYLTFLGGSLATVADIWRGRHREDWRDENRALACEEIGAAPEAVDHTLALSAPVAEDELLSIARQLWVDRFALASLAVVIGLVAALVGGPRAVGISLAAFAALVAIYEMATPKPDVRTNDTPPPEVMRLFDIHDVRAVCMGHTHRPLGTWGTAGEGRFYGNSGAWCPAYKDLLCVEPAFANRPLLMLIANDDACWGGLYAWGSGALAPVEAASRAGPSFETLGAEGDGNP